MAPEPTSEAIYGFFELIMVTGCETSPAIRALDAERRFAACHDLREDGLVVQAPKSESATLEWLKDHPTAFAVLSYAVFDENRQRLAAASIDGTQPTAEAVGAGRYSLERPIFLYVKNRHVASVPGLQELVYEFTSERAISPDGYLVEKGLVALDDIGRNAARDKALSLEPL
jgi:phosphate transport system substrate-binding protein